MASHVPNRRDLNDAERTELDNIIAEYTATRERARNALIAAQVAYHETVGDAAKRRDDRILDIIEAAESEGRGTQSRIVEYLNMNPSYLSLRIRNARLRANQATNDESVTLHHEG